MKVIGLTGFSGSGKTTLLTAMVRLLGASGLTVSTVKHAHHGFDLDRPGKDSFRHRAAGAREVLIAGERRWALMHEVRGDEPTLPELLGHLAPVDVVVVEGYKANPHPKIEVHRPALGHPALWPGRDDIVAVASDEAISAGGRPVFDLNDAAVIVAWTLQFLRIDAPLQHSP
ncbi:MAG TPA: molybdopterin-guanine dinucleotide biosynthesis protein B [Acetobacteraceae bacterium]|nr:molybdopterin-guanine dinucleotide biosynthesis protein B [Acetobacteraceae bacterium]